VILGVVNVNINFMYGHLNMNLTSNRSCMYERTWTLLW